MGNEKWYVCTHLTFTHHQRIEVFFLSAPCASKSSNKTKGPYEFVTHDADGTFKLNLSETYATYNPDKVEMRVYTKAPTPEPLLYASDEHLQPRLEELTGPANSFQFLTLFSERDKIPIMGVAWSISEEEIEIALTAKTDGYLSFGFQNPDKPNSWMIGGEAVMAWIDDEGVPVVNSYYMGGYTIDDMELLPDYLTISKVTLVDGIMQLTFIRPLRLSTSQASKTISVNPEAAGLLWAIHPTFNGLKLHSESGQILLDLLTGQSDEIMTQTLWSWIAAATFVVITLLAGLVLNSTSLKHHKSVRRFMLRKVGRPGKMTEGPQELIRFCKDMSFAQTLLWWGLIGMLVAFVVMEHWQNQMWTRALGWASTICMGLTTLPISRTSLWIWFFGISFERAVAYHRAFARVTLLVILLHGVTLIVKHGGDILWMKEYGASISPRFGLISYLCVHLMSIFALPVVRRKFFEVFIGSHLLLLFPAYVFAAIHIDSLLHKIVLLSPLSLYGVDRIIRFSRRFNKATVLDAQLVSDDVLALKVKMAHRFDFEPGGWAHMHSRES